MSESRTTNDPGTWPARPTDEVFPLLLNTIETAQLLRYDAKAGRTPQQAARLIRDLVYNHGLPTAGRIGGKLMFNRDAVLEWLAARGSSEVGTGSKGGEAA